MVLWGSLKLAEQRREAKGKGEKEIYTHLNAEFQRIATRDKKAFFSDQGKEIEENNRMENTKDLFKKIRDTKGRYRASLIALLVKNPPAIQETPVLFLSWEDLLEKG